MGSFSTPTEQLDATSAAEKGPAISDSGSPALAADRGGGVSLTRHHQRHHPVHARLTCTVAEGEAQPPPGAVEHHVEAFHDRGANHQAVDG